MNLLLTSLRAGMLTPGHQKHITAANGCINTAVRQTASPARAGQAAPTPAAVPGKGLRQQAAGRDGTRARAGDRHRSSHRPTQAGPGSAGGCRPSEHQAVPSHSQPDPGTVAPLAILQLPFPREASGWSAANAGRGWEGSRQHAGDESAISLPLFTVILAAELAQICSRISSKLQHKLKKTTKKSS